MRFSAVSCALAFLFLILVKIRRLVRVSGVSCSAFFNYISGGAIAPPGNEFAPPVKPFLPPKCEAELLMIAVRIAVDLLDNEIMPFHSHLVCNSYCSSPSIS